MKRTGWISVIAVFLAVAAFAFGILSRRGAPDASAPPPVEARAIDGHAGHEGAPSDTPSTRAYREAADRMHQAMNIDYSGDADIDFLRGMIAHHEGAIAMARIAVEEGEADDVRGLAQEIIRAQEAEILRMRIMLARHEDAPAVSERP
ncbi:MAG: DUF305 domain-containing protein [Brevundimonas sp.]|jgi:hypothetical protein|uniref:CopM family metallochaperone n=1 Tax=unclassified Brevundimonas TaxID=2622653 RepID=UPI0017A2EABC|nr:MULTISPECIES: DUF305 domain-containing protein [unclassified Brevundimonas]MBA4805524.1 DUF305 domain-containing protein [Brevundimonas sp.]MBA4809188.1 DUF305 domain-containing protein [Brevundimonas sp.]MBN9465257.1 DUF305 domain-containing protein [Brevundimonas sp.]QYF85907.1 DUF305 domain-containing protein [Brevundimonas sp. PAMC22021]